MTTTPSGWYADPEHTGQQRYWDGTAWTDHRQPLLPPPPAPPVPAPAPMATAEPTVVRTDLAPVTPVGFAPHQSGALVVPEAPVSHATPVPAGQSREVGRSPLGHEVAGAGKRFGGICLDVLLGWIPIVSFVWLMIAWTRGQSIGKSMIGTVVVDVNTGRRVGWGRMFLRQFVGAGLLGILTLSVTFWISCFLVLSGDRRTVWDRVAGTMVVTEASGPVI